MDDPEGLAVEPDGALLVVEAGTGTLTRIRPDGSREAVATGLSTRIRATAALVVVDLFANVALTADGDVLVSSPELARLPGWREVPRPDSRAVREGRVGESENP